MMLKSLEQVHILGQPSNVFSDQGHLCNEDGADAMIRTIGNKTKKDLLGSLFQRK